MASIYARGQILWIKFKGADGKPVCKSSGHRRGEEAIALELAHECERQATDTREVGPLSLAPVAAPLPELPAPVGPPLPPVAKLAPVVRVGPEATPGALTVRAYGEQWIARRIASGMETAEGEASHLRLHVFEVIGHMALADVRPRHVNDMVNVIKARPSAARKCKGDPIAPRTVRRVFASVIQMFKSAVIDEHIAASPVVLEAGVLPQNMDKDPEWRSSATFEREEAIELTTSPRVAFFRRVFYALEYFAGLRHSETAALRFRSRIKTCSPLRKLVVARSGKKKRTKTKITREVPIHPFLDWMLDEWEAWGWAEKYGRAPTPDDLIVPTERFGVRQPSQTLREFYKDLAMLGLRRRRGHDRRRTFITLTRADGGRSEVLRPITHPGERDVYDDYTTFPWPVVCTEIAKLRLPEPPTSPVSAPAAELVPAPEVAPAPVAPVAPSAPIARDEKSSALAEGAPLSYIASYTPDCSPENDNDTAPLRAVAGLGQRFRKP